MPSTPTCARLVLLALGVVVQMGCGSSSGAGTSPRASQSSEPGSCSATAFTGSWSGNVATSQVVSTVELRNTSTSACFVDGYPTVSFVDADGHEVTLPTNDVLDPKPAKIQVQPAGSAAFHMVWSNGIAFASPNCVNASRILVTLPGAPGTVSMPATSSLCTGPGGTPDVSVSAVFTK